MIFPMSSIAQIALLALSASSSATGVGAATANAKNDNDDYEPNGRLGQFRMRNQQHRHQQHLAAHRNNRKLATKSSAATTGTGGSKSSKSGQPEEGGGEGFFEFLDPLPQGCPCFTSADIDAAWDVIKAQDSDASCSYTEILRDGFTDLYLFASSTTGGSDFAISSGEQTSGGFPIGFEPDGTPIFPVSGNCAIEKYFSGGTDEAGTVSASLKREFGSGAFSDCREEVLNSNMINVCEIYEN